jgi:hypothetical protein
MDKQTGQFIGAVVGATVGVALKFIVFPENTGSYWWICMPILFGRLGMSIANPENWKPDRK